MDELSIVAGIGEDQADIHLFDIHLADNHAPSAAATNRPVFAASAVTDAGDLDGEDSEGFDLDGDGVVDTRVEHVGDTVLVISDYDGDGRPDALTVVEADGDYAAWECRRDESGALVWEEKIVGHL